MRTTQQSFFFSVSRKIDGQQVASPPGWVRERHKEGSPFGVRLILFFIRQNVSVRRRPESYKNWKVKMPRVTAADYFFFLLLYFSPARGLRCCVICFLSRSTRLCCASSLIFVFFFFRVVDFNEHFLSSALPAVETLFFMISFHSKIVRRMSANCNFFFRRSLRHRIKICVSICTLLFCIIKRKSLRFLVNC